MKTYSYGQTPVKVIQKALKGKPYPMTMAGSDEKLLTRIVNQGIDSHLEAFTESTFTREQGNIVGNRLECLIGPKDMLVLLRRLEEDGSDEAMDLRTSILCTLDIEEV